MDKSEQAVRGARAALIGKAEIKRLIMAAKRAHKAQMQCGLADEDFNAFRRGAIWEAVKVTSFKAVSHGQLGRALKYFGELAGGGTRADARIVKREESGASDRAKALHVLKVTCQQCADLMGGYHGAESYATALLRKTHKLPDGCEWEAASAKQLWQVMFTLRNRAAAKRAKARCAASEQAGGGDDTQAGRGGREHAFPTSGKTNQ